MINIMAVFIGGGLGSIVRYLFTCIAMSCGLTYYAPATFAVNFLGCMLIGFLYVIFASKIDIPQAYAMFLITGFCGGLTTFSTFSLETVKFIQDGMYLHALGYSVLSVIVCLCGVFAGGYLVRYAI